MAGLAVNLDWTRLGVFVSEVVSLVVRCGFAVWTFQVLAFLRKLWFLGEKIIG